VARLLASVKHDARAVVGAFLAHDLATLRRYAGPELLERLTGVFAHFDAQGGLREDPTILFVGDPELVEVRMVEGDPMVVVQFACQQIKATRDKFGNVVDGSPNSIQRVFYFWGLVQDKQGVVLPDGRPLPPRWALRDMMWQSVLALV
jgi:mitochondrial import inner membrane translocase subunit TIM44